MNRMLNWHHQASEIPEQGLTVERSATARERGAIASALDLAACDRLDARYQIRPLERGRYVLMGTLSAEVVQTCVVTLEPVRNRIEEQIDVEFWPQHEFGDQLAGSFEAFAGVDPEPMEDGAIAAGRVFYEHLAAALDPYPRKEGAVFTWTDRGAADRSGTFDSPFDVLGQWKS
jgi:hypothetical protein